MTRRTGVAAVVVPCSALLAIAAFLPGSQPVARAAPETARADAAAAAHVRAEVTRLQMHFDDVDRELRARDVSDLSPAQRSARGRLIAWLRDYRDRAEFPLNDGYADRAVPIFRDADGTLCAMAYLIERAGRADIVDRVAATRNTAYIRELVDDPTLVAWLDENGLSAAEAARIQPYYGPLPPPPAETDDVDSGYALASMALAGASIGTTWLNLDSPTPTRAALGLGAGGLSMLAGLVRIDDGGGTAHVAAANMVLGAVAIGAGVHALLRDGDEPVVGARVGSAELSLQPELLHVDDRQAFGMLLRARF